jgi:hypothetical protein
MKRLVVTIVLALGLVVAGFGSTATAHKLPARVALNQTFQYAKRACNVDRFCYRYKASTCSRQSLHVVICRAINFQYNAKDGYYRCQRRVRVIYPPRSFHPRITGFTRWVCR